MQMATPIEINKLDQLAMEKYKIPGILLMENAALSIVAKATEMLVNAPTGSKTVIIAGKGNNGGDAYATARHLIQKGYPVITISIVQRNMITGEANTYLQILESIGAPVFFASNEEELKGVSVFLKEAFLIVDGIFGTGFHGNVSGFYKSLIQIINESNGKVLSIDIPSGVNGENGQIGGIAVKADETVTFSLPKPGLMQYPGAGFAGRITVSDISIPAAAIKELRLDGELSEADMLHDFIPERAVNSHKNTFGKVLIITGSTGMTGAGALAARAAFKTGSGMVYLAVPESLSPIYGATIPEAIIIPLKDVNGLITDYNLDMLLYKTKSCNSIVIGPGLSSEELVAEWVKPFVSECRKPMVIDADALNIIARETDVFKKRQGHTVITPHPGEFSRLTELSVDEIQQNRIKTSLEYSRKWNVTVVLKGAGTVIANPCGKYFINTAGNPVLAVAGSGDVLAGITGSLIGQGVKHDEAAVLGAYIHGRCGDALSDKSHMHGGFTASEICAEIPFVMGELKRIRRTAP